MGLWIQALPMDSFSWQGSAFLDEGNAMSTNFKILWIFFCCWCTQWIITIECVRIIFTHTSTFVLDIDNVGIVVFWTF